MEQLSKWITPGTKHQRALFRDLCLRYVTSSHHLDWKGYIFTTSLKENVQIRFQNVCVIVTRYSLSYLFYLFRFSAENTIKIYNLSRMNIRWHANHVLCYRWLKVAHKRYSIKAGSYILLMSKYLCYSFHTYFVYIPFQSHKTQLPKYNFVSIPISHFALRRIL